MDLPSHDDFAAVIQFGADLLAAKRYYVGCCALIVYDWLLTLNDELSYIWFGTKGPVFVLFLLNRYIPILFMIVTVFAYFSPLWTFEICERFAITEWVQALLISISAELVLLFRTYALTSRNKPLGLLLSAIIIAQCTVVFYAMSRKGENPALPVPDFPGIDAYHICVLYSNPHMDMAYLCLTISFDFLVFVTTLIVTFQASFWRDDVTLHTKLRRDGSLYFLVIFSGNFVWMILSLLGRPGVKLINAQPSMLFTSIMINRLTLSLRAAAVRHRDEWSLRSFEFPAGAASQDRNNLNEPPHELVSVASIEQSLRQGYTGPPQVRFAEFAKPKNRNLMM